LVAPCEMAGVASGRPAAPKPATPMPFNTHRRETRIDLLPLFSRSDGGPDCLIVSIISIASRRKRHYARMGILHVISANGPSDQQ
jgi:hypothetical protein